MDYEQKHIEEKNLLKESHIPRLIIGVPIISIVITAISIVLIFVAGFNNYLNTAGDELGQRLLDDGKLEIKEEVEGVIRYIDYNRKNAEKGLIDELRNRVETGYAIIESIYAYNNKDKSSEEIIDIIRESLRNVRFYDNRGYYFIHRNDLESNDFTILQPNMPWLEGDHQLEDKDLDGKLISESAYNLLTTEGEGFLSFNFYLDDENRKERKLAYVKLFEPLNIFIGTGEYLYYYEEEVKKDILLWLESYEYDDGNYMFIYDDEGKVLMHPISPNLVNKNLSDIRDSQGFNIGREYLKSVGNTKGVYVSYNWLDPDTNMDVIKTGYALNYKDWNWNIATGLYMNYLDDLVETRQVQLKAEIRSVVLKTIIIVFFLLIISFIITLIFAKFTTSLFTSYNQDLMKSAEELNLLNLSLEERIKIKTDELEIKNSELEQLAIIDSLSGIYNRRYFDTILNKEWYRHMRNKKVMALIMCDIDFFKQYNDTYGHQKGDECIQLVGKILKNTCKRPIDIPVRYGGEEFALILPQTDEAGARDVSLKIQSELNNLEIEHKNSLVSNFLSISIGVSSLIPKKGQSYSEIVGLADAALYRAKSNGRNRVES